MRVCRHISFTHMCIAMAMENMQFEKGKKEIINSKKADFVQNHTFYAKKKVFSAERKDTAQKSI